MPELRLVKGLTLKAQEKFEERQAVRKRVASVLHILKAEIEACSLVMGECTALENSPESVAELREKATGLQSVAHLIGVLEPSFEDPEYSMRSKPFSAATAEWANNLSRRKKKKTSV